MKKLATFIFAILAGASIAMGGVVYLIIENKIVGALFFTLGLFMVLTHGLNLFTGKICYVFENDRTYALNIPVIWLGNLVGAAAIGLLMQLTRLSGIAQRAAEISQVKLSDGLLSVFILAILCNILIFIAVDGFVKKQQGAGKYIGLFFGVSVFVICGFEHCVANMFYFTAGGAWSLRTLLYVLVATMGNAVGGVIFPLARQFREKIDAGRDLSGSVK